MRITDAVSNKAVGAYSKGSLSDAARQRRWQRLAAAFPDLADMHVLDIGGDARAWHSSGLRPAHVTLVNVFSQDVNENWISSVTSDACDLPAGLSGDLVYSNSVIEHVGGHWRRERLAEGIRNAGPRYWVQTPYRYFPIEPHFLFPGLQHLPKVVQAHAVARWPFGNHRMVTDSGEALGRTMNIELLGASEMRAYFPDGRLERERFAGLTKSLIAIR